MVTNVSDSPLLVDSASATTNLNCPEATTPLGGVTMMFYIVKLTVPPIVV